jgi:hypothetical protein
MGKGKKEEKKKWLYSTKGCFEAHLEKSTEKSQIE